MYLQMTSLGRHQVLEQFSSKQLWETHIPPCSLQVLGPPCAMHAQEWYPHVDILVQTSVASEFATHSPREHSVAAASLRSQEALGVGEW